MGSVVLAPVHRPATREASAAQRGEEPRALCRAAAADRHLQPARRLPHCAGGRAASPRTHLQTIQNTELVSNSHLLLAIEVKHPERQTSSFKSGSLRSPFADGTHASLITAHKRRVMRGSQPGAQAGVGCAAAVAASDRRCQQQYDKLSPHHKPPVRVENKRTLTAYETSRLGAKCMRIGPAAVAGPVADPVAAVAEPDLLHAPVTTRTGDGEINRNRDDKLSLERQSVEGEKGKQWLHGKGQELLQAQQQALVHSGDLACATSNWGYGWNSHG